MAKQQIKVGFTDYTTLIFIPDPASTDGSGKTGLVAANLTVSGARVETDNDVTVTDYTSSLNNLAALTTAHTDWGLLEVSSTLAPGLYRLDIADAIFASGAWSAVVYVMITTSAAAASPMEFTLVAYDQNDAAGLGLTNLDATVSSRMATYAQPTGFLAATFPGTVASTTNITGGVITTVTNLTNAATNGDLTAVMKTSVGDACHDEVIEGSTTLRQILRGYAGALLSKCSGLETTTATYRDIGDTKDRIVATVDANGNRTAITLDLS